MKKPYYEAVTELELDTTCVECRGGKWNQLMKGAVRANKRAINSLVKKLLPDLYEKLALQFYNPYNYLRTQKHLILVHSGIEFFLKFRY
jgi:hypothetical protein